MEKDFTQEICELFRITSTDLPAYVKRNLRDAAVMEKERSAAHGAMGAILSNIEMPGRTLPPFASIRAPRSFSYIIHKRWI